MPRNLPALAPNPIRRRPSRRSLATAPLVAMLCAGLLASCTAAPSPGEGAAMAEASVRSAQWKLAQQHEQGFAYDRAADLYGRILNESPDDASAAVAYVRALRYAGDADAAQEAARIALERIGQRRDLRLEQAKAMIAAGRTRTVLPLATALAAEEPDDWQGHSILGLTLESTGQPAEALAEHRKAHALAPQHPQTINNLALAEAADGDLAAALDRLELAAENPRAPLHLRMNLALLYMLADQPQRAEALVRANLPPSAVEPALRNLSQFRGRPDLARDKGRLDALTPAGG